MSLAGQAGQGGRKQRAKAAIADRHVPPHAVEAMLMTALTAALPLPLLDATERRAAAGGSHPNQTERTSAAVVTPQDPAGLLTRCSGSAAVELERATARENQVTKTGTGRHLGAPLNPALPVAAMSPPNQRRARLPRAERLQVVAAARSRPRRSQKAREMTSLLLLVVALWDPRP